MKTMVNEPTIPYSYSGWPVMPLELIPDLSIYNIEDQVIICMPAISLTFDFQKENRRRKIAAMRGSLKGLSDSEIDKQLGDLRNEWERSI